jgi:DnaA family protein
MSQLALGLRLEPNARFETFVAEGSEAVTAHLRQIAAGMRRDAVWLAGPSGAGKTHLLQAACREAGQAGRSAIYLSAADRPPPAALDGLASLDLVAIDDAATLAGDPEMERALFAVVDAYYRGAGGLLLASEAAPVEAGFHLPDLASRAAGTVVYRLAPLSDEARRTALDRLARVRGIELDAPTIDYLLTRLRRDMRTMADWIDRIDRESLVAKRRVTLPFVRELLRRDGLAAGPEPDSEGS